MLKKHIINPLDPKETESPQAFWEVHIISSQEEIEYILTVM